MVKFSKLILVICICLVAAGAGSSLIKSTSVATAETEQPGLTPSTAKTNFITPKPTPTAGSSQSESSDLARPELEPNDISTTEPEVYMPEFDGVTDAEMAEILEGRSQAIYILKTKLGEEGYSSLVEQGYAVDRGTVSDRGACVIRRVLGEPTAEYFCVGKYSDEFIKITISEVNGVIERKEIKGNL